MSVVCVPNPDSSGYRGSFTCKFFPGRGEFLVLGNVGVGVGGVGGGGGGGGGGVMVLLFLVDIATAALAITHSAFCRLALRLSE